MREILFKGKTVKGEWVYGLLSHVGNGWYISDEYGNPLAYEVIPSTIGQYTGLKDKNGVKIFEGDILNMHGGCAQMDVREYDVQCRVAYYRTGRGANIGFSGLYDSGMRADLMCECSLTVIGNIHDDPELRFKGGST